MTSVGPHQACSLRVSAAKTSLSLPPLHLPKTNYTLAMDGWNRPPSSPYPPGGNLLLKARNPREFDQETSCRPSGRASVHCFCVWLSGQSRRKQQSNLTKRKSLVCSKSPAKNRSLKGLFWVGKIGFLGTVNFPLTGKPVHHHLSGSLINRAEKRAGVPQPRSSVSLTEWDPRYQWVLYVK